MTYDSLKCLLVAEVTIGKVRRSTHWACVQRVALGINHVLAVTHRQTCLVLATLRAITPLQICQVPDRLTCPNVHRHQVYHFVASL